MANFPSTLLNGLSAPGLNRPTGHGDVVPYSGTDQGAGQGNGSEFTGQDIGTATPGASGSWADKGSMSPAGTASPGAAGSTFSAASGTNPNQAATARPANSMLANLGPLIAALTQNSSANTASNPAGAPGVATPAQPFPATPDLGWNPSNPAYWAAMSGGGPDGGGGAAAAGPGGPGAGDGGVGAGTGGGGVMKSGGPVTKGNPSSQTDDVPTKLQHGEFVIPRGVVDHLRTHLPSVMSHIEGLTKLHAHSQPPAPMSGPPVSPSAIAGPPQMAQMGGMPAVGRPAAGFAQGGLVTGSQTSSQDEADYQEAMRSMKGGSTGSNIPSGHKQATPAASAPGNSIDKALSDADKGGAPKRGGYFKRQGYADGGLVEGANSFTPTPEGGQALKRGGFVTGRKAKP